jgi:branched-chain amino acid transport system substrate-binding protein
MKFNPATILPLIVFLAAVNLFPQKSNSAFEDGIKLYREMKYYQALDLFEEVIKEYPQNPKITAAIIFKGKTLFALGKTNEAKTTTLDFLNKYPSSSYVDEARFLLVKIYFEDKDYLKAFNQLLNVIDNSGSFIYVTEAVSSAEDLALQYLTVENLRSLIKSYNNEYIKAFLVFLIAQLQIENNLLDDALVTLEGLLSSYPDSDFKEGAELLISQISSGEYSYDTNKTNICAMLPLSGLRSNEALTSSKEILEGIKFAVDEFNNGRDDKIGLIINDTENDSSKIIGIKNEIVNDHSIKIIIGPVFSSEVEIALEEFKNSDIPIISPTATDNDLTQLNENFFQANPNFVIRAKAMAQHIYYVENKRRMAVLNSIDGYSPLLAAEFIKEFEKLGGEIIAKYTYKSEGLSAGIAIDSTELVPAEGLYIPLSNKADVPLILSQLVRNNINLSLYGNQDWFQAKGFETSPELSNKTIFTSDYFIEYNNSSYQDFSKKFMVKTKIDANRNVLYGYDTAKYILTVLRNIGRDRKNVHAKMESEYMVSGFHNNISFNDERVNIFINIVRYNNGYFELVDKFKVSK